MHMTPIGSAHISKRVARFVISLGAKKKHGNGKHSIIEKNYPGS